MAHLATGASAMPRSQRAPYFTGHVDDPLEDFLRDYKELATTHQLNDREKVQTVLRYIPVSLRDYWRSLEGYATQNWGDFRQSLEAKYTGPSACSRYSKQRLHDFVQKASQARMRSEDDVLEYYCGFDLLCKPLTDAGRITTEDRDLAFWLGFHTEDRNRMTARLFVWCPRHATDEAFPFADVFDVACTTFKGLHQLSLLLAELWHLPTGLRASEHATNRPDDRDLRDLNRHHCTDEREYREPDRGWRAPDREPYLQDLPLRREPEQPYILAPNIETRTVRFKEPARDDDDREMEELLDKMHGLSVRERAYAHLYAQCFRLLRLLRLLFLLPTER